VNCRHSRVKNVRSLRNVPEEALRDDPNNGCRAEARKDEFHHARLAFCFPLRSMKEQSDCLHQQPWKTAASQKVTKLCDAFTRQTKVHILVLANSLRFTFTRQSYQHEPTKTKEVFVV